MNQESLEKARMLSQKMDEVCRKILETPDSEVLKSQYREFKEALSSLLLQHPDKEDEP